MQAPLFQDETHDEAIGPRVLVRIALPVPIDSLFDYVVPEAMVENARPGHRALVPFAGRRLTGVIVERLEAAPAGDARRLARVERLVDDEPVVSPAMIELLLRAAHDRLCPVGLALNHALPPGSAPRIAHRLGLTERGRRALADGVASDPARRVLEALREGPLTPATLARRLSGQDPPVRELTRDGLVAKLQVETGPGAREARERVALLAPGLDLEATCSGPLARAPKQAELLRRVAREGEVATRELSAETATATALLRTLERRGFVQLRERIAPRDVLGPPTARDEQLPLTPEQADALQAIEEAMAAGRAQRFLLHGVTGSGKTEVYLRAVDRALRDGRQALVLVPEITLTHQIVARLRARFGDDLAVLHSGLRPGERLEQWQRLRRGEVSIAVGARSALFAPIERLGVIVVDEEHDPAYKNEEGFRYHARDLALRRARLAGCPVVLGTATPALETRYEAEQGEIRRLVLSRRIGGRPLPAVEMVDLVAERAKAPRGRKLILAGPLRRAMRETLAAGGQTILFLNRRGFSTQVYCFDCGFAERCKDCDVALVYHAGENRLRCHYCDHGKPPPAVCGGCGSPDTALLGLGTERVEEEVRTLFPAARIARLDRDTAQRRGHTESVLRALREREVDVLIGTQMVAKGHDFPGVQLVGVVAADLGLHMPDFRAAERTFQVLTQVAGRAGRAGTPGPRRAADLRAGPLRDPPRARPRLRELLPRRARAACAGGLPAVHAPVPGARLRSRRGRDPRRRLRTRGRRRRRPAGRHRDGGRGGAGPGARPARPAARPLPLPAAAQERRPAVLEPLARRIAERATALPKPLRAVVDVDPGSML